MKIIKEKTVAFVGSHSLITPKNVTDRNLENVIRTELLYVIEELHKEGKDTFLSEVENEFEILAAEAVLEYAQSHEEISLYTVTKSTTSDKKDVTVRCKQIFKAVTGRLVVTEERIDDFLIGNSSEVIIYGSDEEPEVIRMYDKAEQKCVESWNMYNELKDYFSIQSPAKQFLQDYSLVSSFKYGREGIIFQGYNQLFPVSFAEITQVKEERGLLCFKLKDGMVIMASLFSETCYVKQPPFSQTKSDYLC